MTISETILFDTNVLVYNQDQDSRLYPQATSYHQRVFSGEIKAVISSQSLLEFAVVMINPKKIIKPLTPKEVSGEIKKYLGESRFEIIYPNQETIVLFASLFQKYPLRHPRQAFDLFLVVTALSHGVTKILTANVQDFQFPKIKAIDLTTAAPSPRS